MVAGGSFLSTLLVLYYTAHFIYLNPFTWTRIGVVIWWRAVFCHVPCESVSLRHPWGLSGVVCRVYPGGLLGLLLCIEVLLHSSLSRMSVCAPTPFSTLSASSEWWLSVDRRLLAVALVPDGVGGVWGAVLAISFGQLGSLEIVGDHQNSLEFVENQQSPWKHWLKGTGNNDWKSWVAKL